MQENNWSTIMNLKEMLEEVEGRLDATTTEGVKKLLEKQSLEWINGAMSATISLGLDLARSQDALRGIEFATHTMALIEDELKRRG